MLQSNKLIAFFGCVLFAVVAAPSCSRSTTRDIAPDTQADAIAAQVSGPVSAIHVHPGGDIQAALDKAASDDSLDTVVVHAGVYRPDSPRQALIWLNKRHNGIHLLAKGDVTLTAANPEIADQSAESFPAITNHVVYVGDGIDPETKIEGFRIAGANNFVTTKGPPIEPADDPLLEKTGYFYFDGGGVKIFGRSYPTLEALEIVDNYASPCGAGISIEHRGFIDDRVTVRNCVFRNNRVPLTGAALDLLGHDKGSAVLVENCLFVDNAANRSMDSRSRRLGTWRPKVGHGAITLFEPCRAEFRNCTIVGNQNGVDDMSPSSTYEKCIFWQNTAGGGWPIGPRYETTIANGPGMSDCFIGGHVNNSKLPLDPKRNVLDAPAPEFDEHYVPQNTMYEGIGYRPVGQQAPTTNDERPAASASASDDEITTETLLVRVKGSDFNWYFSYVGDDGIPGTADDIRLRRHLFLPTNRPVQIQLESDDYLYSLKLPAQGANEIAVPGMVHYCTVSESQPGSYPLDGDQFCGYAHPNLIGRVVFQPSDLFHKSLSANQIR